MKVLILKFCLELSGGMRQVAKNNLIFKRMNTLLVVHDQNQDADLDFWRIGVPDKQEIKSTLYRRCIVFRIVLTLESRGQ